VDRPHGINLVDDGLDLHITTYAYNVKRNLFAACASGKQRKQGREHLIALNPEPLDTAAKWIEEQRSLWAWRLGELDKALTEGKP
jgi:hypothetical protein